jgi:molybdopterin/thiamine biosynthesis adenylyltransferase
MRPDRFDRNERFFGKEGQVKIRASRVAIVGVGGLGTHVVQQLSLLGVGALALVDAEEIDRTNLNRYVEVHHEDPIPGTRKVDVGERLARSVDPTIQVVKVFDSLISECAFEVVKQADYVFGCVDREGVRFVLNELCTAYSRPYFDLASDIPQNQQLIYGGRVCVSLNGDGCLVCLDVLDQEEVRRDLASPAERQDRERIYGVDRSLLDETGPSVVSINGVIASLAVTEFMVTVTGIRAPQRLLTYYGHSGKVTASTDTPMPDCWYCKGIYGYREKADVERYLRSDIRH